MKTKIFTHTTTYGFCKEETAENTHKLKLVADKYSSNGTLAIIVMEILDDGTEDRFDIITTNLPFGDADETRAYIDTNNCPWAETMLKQHGFAKDTGERGHCGFCTYPLYEFNLNTFDQ